MITKSPPDSLGKAEEEKANMLVEIETLNSEIKNKRNKTERNDEDIKLKLQHFKVFRLDSDKV